MSSDDEVITFSAKDSNGQEKVVQFTKRKKAPRKRADGTVIPLPTALAQQAEKVKRQQIPRDSRGRFMKKKTHELCET